MQFFLYCLCGGAGVSTDFATFYILLKAGVWYQNANAAGYLVGTLVSFSLNRIFTFGLRDRLLQRLAMFVAIASLGFAASMALLWLLVDIVSVRPEIAKLLTFPMVVVLQFLLNRRLTFKS